VTAGAPREAAVPAGLALAAGAVFGLQTRINGELGQRSASALWAALVSFGSGLVLLVVLVAAVPRLRRAARAAAANRLPWWTYTGGVAGGTLVAISAVAVPLVGVATFTVGVVAGQAAGGLLVDRSRLGPGGPRPLSAARLTGAALAVLAVGIVRLGHTGGAVSGRAVLALLVASTLAGAWGAVQQALNGRVQRATGQPLLAALINFAAGTAALAVVLAVAAPAGAGPDRAWPGAAWLYVGGALGIVYISVAAWAVRPLGVLRLGLLVVAGQLAGGVLIDLVSPAHTGGLRVATVFAVLLTLAGVALAGRRPRQRSSGRV
jgi:transporter family-2 protein